MTAFGESVSAVYWAGTASYAGIPAVRLLYGNVALLFGYDIA